MSTNYDEIAEEYKRSKTVAWRQYIEQHSLCELLGDVTGASVLDLACGDGHYTRILKRMGASSVVGVDNSEKMIDLAVAAERLETLGIEYHVTDARHIDFGPSFDVVVAAYLLNYARSEDDLLAMAEAIHRSLKPGGRFVAVNNNPDQKPSSFRNTRKYGFVKSAGGDLHDGEPVLFTFFQDAGEFVVENYHLSAAAHISAFNRAGFSDARWHAPAAASNGHDDYWDEFLSDPPIALFSCAKRAAAHAGSAGRA